MQLFYCIGKVPNTFTLSWQASLTVSTHIKVHTPLEHAKDRFGSPRTKVKPLHYICKNALAVSRVPTATSNRSTQSTVMENRHANKELKPHVTCAPQKTNAHIWTLQSSSSLRSASTCALCHQNYVWVREPRVGKIVSGRSPTEA